MGDKVSIRTCVSCGKKARKQDLLRVVRLPQGNIEIDISSNAPGRGAYVCKSGECFDKAIKKGAFCARLRRKISAEQAQQLRADFQAHIGALL